MVRHGRRLALGFTALGSLVLWLVAAPAAADHSAWLVTGAVLAAATTAAALAASTARQVSRSRPWWLLAAACSAWAGGAAFWAVDAAAAAIDLPAASPADLFYLAFYPLAAAALLTMPGAPTLGCAAECCSSTASSPRQPSWRPRGPSRSRPALGGAGPEPVRRGGRHGVPVRRPAAPRPAGLAGGRLARGRSPRRGAGGRLGRPCSAVRTPSYALVVNAGGSTLGGAVNVGYVGAFGLLGAAAFAARRVT